MFQAIFKHISRRYLNSSTFKHLFMFSSTFQGNPLIQAVFKSVRTLCKILFFQNTDHLSWCGIYFEAFCIIVFSKILIICLVGVINIRLELSALQ